jgi:RNA binding exosome subunit
MNHERPVKSVELTALVHATEDQAKVRKAILNLVPADAEPPAFEAMSLTGYYNDPITALRMTLKNRRPSTDLVVGVFKRLNSLDQTTLLDELPQRIDENKNMYIRLDKQRACRGQVSLSAHDSIRLKAKLQVPHGGDPVEIVRAYLEMDAVDQP